MARLSLGVDFGTNSVRGLLIDVDSGLEVATEVCAFTSGEAGVLLDPTNPLLARQSPEDYHRGLRDLCRRLLVDRASDELLGIGIDTTGSSPIPVDEDGRPLAIQERYRDRMDAQCWLWKDHTAHDEAEEITDLARRRGEPYLSRCGGTYSSEWFWSKILRCARQAPNVFEAAHSWTECCDYITSYLVGNPRAPRSICAAGHKAMYAQDWGGLPSKAFLSELDPRLADLRDRLYEEARPSNEVAGRVAPSIADDLALQEGTPVAVGTIDAHAGAVGSGVGPGVLVKILGTSSCDCMVHRWKESIPDIPGLSGIARDSILPGYFGLEAGQPAVGDIFNWFADFVRCSHEELSGEAEHLAPGESGLLALDWNNGNRSVLADPLLSGLVIGANLHTRPAEVYRALIEASAFGALMIIKRLEAYGVGVDKIVACGGIAEKNPLVMQIYADVCDRPIAVAASEQTCALGAAILGAVAGGAFSDVESAQSMLVPPPTKTFLPHPESVRTYAELFDLYAQLHDAFGIPGHRSELGTVMRRLHRLRTRVAASNV